MNGNTYNKKASLKNLTYTQSGGNVYPSHQRTNIMEVGLGREARNRRRKNEKRKNFGPSKYRNLAVSFLAIQSKDQSE